MSYPPQPWPVPAPGPAPLDQPQYDATIGQAASRFWRKFAVFSGRASRSEYWWWSLIATGIGLVLEVVGSVIFGGGLLMSPGNPVFTLSSFLLPLIPALVWSVIALVPSLALTVRRLHDTNRSGWWYLLVLPSLAGLLLEMVALQSFTAAQLGTGGSGGFSLGPLIGGFVLVLVGAVGSIILLVFLILGPDPRGARFDRRG